MLANNLFEKIGFSDDMIEVYNSYSPIIGNDCERLAKAYMRENKPFKDALAEAKMLAPEVNENIVNLLFILECTGYTYEDYKARNISDDIFYHSMEDITFKVRECKKIKGVYGTFVPTWYQSFFKCERFAFGRLQYDYYWFHSKESININGFQINEGDKTLYCHIPSSGPLLYKDVIDSLRQARDFFTDRVRDGVLFVECFSWLLFPEYRHIFKTCSENIDSFIDNFYIYGSYDYEKFTDCWRIFNVDIDECVVDQLPEDTRLQKGFKKYLQENSIFGDGQGILLFDGEKILTRKKSIKHKKG